MGERKREGKGREWNGMEREKPDPTHPKSPRHMHRHPAQRDFARSVNRVEELVVPRMSFAFGP